MRTMRSGSDSQISAEVDVSHTVEAFTPARMLRIHFDSQGHSHAQYLAIETSSVFVERLAKECKTLGSLWTKACYGENNINNRVVCRLLLLKLLTIASAVDS
jgi:hypothetical protein